METIKLTLNSKIKMFRIKFKETVKLINPKIITVVGNFL